MQRNRLSNVPDTLSNTGSDGISAPALELVVKARLVPNPHVDFRTHIGRVDLYLG